jgi:hypothetical protein
VDEATASQLCELSAKGWQCNDRSIDSMRPVADITGQGENQLKADHRRLTVSRTRAGGGKIFIVLITAFFAFIVTMLLVSASSWTVSALIICTALALLAFLSALEIRRVEVRGMGRVVGAVTGGGAALLVGFLNGLPGLQLVAVGTLGALIGASYREWIRFA